MNSREQILARVRSARPPAVPLPDVASAVAQFPRSAEVLTDRMVRVASAGGAHVVESRREQLPEIVRTAAPAAKHIASMVDAMVGNRVLLGDPHTLADLDVFVCEGEFGVAEDGSVWIPDTRLGQRAALFIAAHVVLVLQRDRLLETLHDAYRDLDLSAQRFGIFVAGPSKTADIEQSLVIGAHGPKGLTLVLVE